MIEIKAWKKMYIVAVVDTPLAQDFADIFNKVINGAISKDNDLARIFKYCLKNEVKREYYIGISNGDEEYLKNYARKTLESQLPGKDLNNLSNYFVTTQVSRDGNLEPVLLYFVLE